MASNEINDNQQKTRPNAGKFKAGDKRTKEAGRKGGQSKGKNKELA